MRPVLLCGLLLAMVWTQAAAIAQSGRIGQIKTAAGEVAVIRGGQRLPLKIGDPIYEKDIVETGRDGSVGMTFIDNSVFSAGPESRLALDQFQFDSSNFKGAMLADMQKGTLNVVSGDIARSSPGNMKIKTPTAILGVRGTTFAVQVY